MCISSNRSGDTERERCSGTLVLSTFTGAILRKTTIWRSVDNSAMRTTNFQPWDPRARIFFFTIHQSKSKHTKSNETDPCCPTLARPRTLTPTLHFPRKFPNISQHAFVFTNSAEYVHKQAHHARQFHRQTERTNTTNICVTRTSLQKPRTAKTPTPYTT